MNKVITAAMLVGLLAAFAGQPEATAQDKIYKWVDDEGVVHYTARPPDDMDYEELGVEAESSDDSTTGQDASAEEESADNTAGGTDSGNGPLTTIDPEQLAADCEQSRSNLENLTEKSNVVMRNEDGTQRRIGEDTRQELIEQSRQFIDRWCQDQPATDT